MFRERANSEPGELIVDCQKNCMCVLLKTVGSFNLERRRSVSKNGDATQANAQGKFNKIQTNLYRFEKKKLCSNLIIKNVWSLNINFIWQKIKK